MRANIETVKKQLASAANVVRGERTIEGIVYDMFEADMENHEYAYYTTHDNYWVDRKIAYVVKSTTLLKQGKSEAFTMQTWKQIDTL